MSVYYLIILFFRLSDVMCLWQYGGFTHLKKCKASIEFLQTNIGLKSRLDLVFAFKQLIQDNNSDKGT